MTSTRNTKNGNASIENRVKFDEKHHYNPGRPITLKEMIAAYDKRIVRK